MFYKYHIFLMATSLLYPLLAVLSQEEQQALCLALIRLKHVYPDHIKEVHDDNILWTDNTLMPLHDSSNKSGYDKLNNPSLADQLIQPRYRTGRPEHSPEDDPGRIRYEQFFRRMYGNSPNEVESHLEDVPWMPGIFGKNARVLRVTNVNKVHEKVRMISKELEVLVNEHPEYRIFLHPTSGTYNWRFIAHTNRLSAHSFGMTLDLNASACNYWQWDLSAEGHAISEDAVLSYRNTVPWDIIKIFEKYGFIWGGKWYHYDTMHFEYRPELMIDDDPRAMQPLDSL